MSFSLRAARFGACLFGVLAAVAVAHAASTTNYTYDAAGNLTGVTGCTPTTCAAQGTHCGSTPDGCGGTLWCTCATGLVCNASNVCVTAAPVPPTGLSATAQSSSSIQVSWNASTGATSYKVQRAPDASGSPGTWGTAVTTTASPYPDSGLTASTRYWYRVAASNSGGDSAYTSAVSATTQVSPVLAVSPASLTFSGTAGGANPVAKTVTATNSGGGTLAVPTTSVSYGSGSGWLSTSVSGSAVPYAVTVTPSISGLGAGTYTATISVSSSGATGSPQSVSVTLAVGGGGTTKTFGRTTEGSTWTAFPPNPGSISVSRFTLTENASVTKLSVVCNAAATGHFKGVIYGAGAVNTPTMLVASTNEITNLAVGTNDLPFATPVSLTPGDYYLGIWGDQGASVNAQGNTGDNVWYGLTYTGTPPATWDTATQFASVNEKPIYATYIPTGGSSPPQPPTNPAASAQSPSSIHFTWAASAGAASYKVESALDIAGVAGVWTPIASGVTQTSYTDTGLSASTTYWYRVAASNSYGDSAYTSAVSATTLVGGGGAPFGDTGIDGASATTIEATSPPDAYTPGQKWADRSHGWATAGRIHITRVIMPATGSVTGFRTFFGTSIEPASALPVRALVYSDSSGVPGTFLGASAELTIPTGTNWLTLPLSSPLSMSSGQAFWIGIWGGGTGTNIGESVDADPAAYNWAYTDCAYSPTGNPVTPFPGMGGDGQWSVARKIAIVQYTIQVK